MTNETGLKIVLAVLLVAGVLTMAALGHVTLVLFSEPGEWWSKGIFVAVDAGFVWFIWSSYVGVRHAIERPFDDLRATNDGFVYDERECEYAQNSQFSGREGTGGWLDESYWREYTPVALLVALIGVALYPTARDAYLEYSIATADPGYVVSVITGPQGAIFTYQGSFTNASPGTGWTIVEQGPRSNPDLVVHGFREGWTSDPCASHGITGEFPPGVTFMCDHDNGDIWLEGLPEVDGVWRLTIESPSTTRESCIVRGELYERLIDSVCAPGSPT